MIVGIDPGTATVGFSFVSGSKQNPVIHDYGVLTTAPRPEEEMPDRLVEIAADLESLLIKHKPQKAIVEKLFASRNVTTVISVAQARGVIVYLLRKHHVEITSLTPHEIKQSITGFGRADKKQMQQMVQRIFKLDTLPKPDDAADALGMGWIGLPISDPNRKIL